MAKWNFPSAQGVGINGFNNIGEEFKDNPIASLAKEICQNSLDTKFNDEYNLPKKKIIDFNEFWIKAEDIPNVDEFRNVLLKEVKFNDEYYKNDKRSSRIL